MPISELYSGEGTPVRAEADCPQAQKAAEIGTPRA